MGERLREVRTDSGRRLGVAQWGDLDGILLFFLHGTPGSRFTRPPHEDELRAMGARVITYDRPGYGASGRPAGRRVVDCADDVRRIADALGVRRFAVVGRSGGGPHALAVAARLPDRVLRALCDVGGAPPDAVGLDVYAGMDPVNVRLFELARQDEQQLYRELERRAAADLERIATHPSQVLSDEWQLDPADRRVLLRRDVQQVMGEAMREAFRCGVWGWVDDDLAFVRPWGFDVSEIGVPVEVRYGAHDVLVPPAHGAWLAEHVPGARVTADADAGHLTDPDRQLELLRRFLADCG